MGFSTIVSQVIMFTAIVSIVTFSVITIVGYVKVTDYSLSSKSEQLLTSIKSDITIINVSSVVESNICVVTTYVRNSGKTIIADNSSIDVYLDNQRVMRANSSVIIADDYSNPGIIDPSDVFKVTTNSLFHQGFHKVKVFAGSTSYDEEIFSVASDCLG